MPWKFSSFSICLVQKLVSKSGSQTTDCLLAALWYPSLHMYDLEAQEGLRPVLCFWYQCGLWLAHPEMAVRTHIKGSVRAQEKAALRGS